jgi:3-isopropylmalate/(R)-2-methylmalate dehydratase small subunit
MQPFKTHSGTAAVLSAENIDTDQILPARFLKKPRSADYSNFVFYDLRRDANGDLRPSFPLNRRDITPTILITGSNFGCGSSREGAVYGLVDAGIRVVIATRIADIFRNNAISNGMLPIELETSSMDCLMASVDTERGSKLTVDLERQAIMAPEETVIEFEIAATARRRLLLGLDDITETIALIDTIEASERHYHAHFPWSTVANRHTSKQT